MPAVRDMQKLAAYVLRRDCLSFRVIKVLIQLHSASSLPFILRHLFDTKTDTNKQRHVVSSVSADDDTGSLCSSLAIIADPRYL